MTDPIDVDYGPARLSTGISILAGALTVVTIGLLGTALATVAVSVGVLVLGVALSRGARRGVSIGAFLMFAGVVIAGIAGARSDPLLVGTVGVVLAWDVGEHAINVGEQLGRAADTRRGEVVHAAGSTLVGAVGMGVGYGIYRLATGGQPLAALFLFLVAAIALIEALRD